MGSVIDYFDCPVCGNEAFSDFYYKSGEEYVHCSHCGYHRSATIKNRDKALNELTEDDWDYREDKNPYGAFRYKFVGDLASMAGTIDGAEHVAEMKESLEEMERNDGSKVEFFTISRFIDGKIVTEDIIGSEPDVADYIIP